MPANTTTIYIYGALHKYIFNFVLVLHIRSIKSMAAWSQNVVCNHDKVKSALYLPGVYVKAR